MARADSLIRSKPCIRRGDEVRLPDGVRGVLKDKIGNAYAVDIGGGHERIVWSRSELILLTHRPKQVPRMRPHDTAGADERADVLAGLEGYWRNTRCRKCKLFGRCVHRRHALDLAGLLEL